MSRTIFLSAVLAGAWIEACCAQEKVLPLQGVGAATCAQFAEAYRDSPKEMENLFFSWAQGYMSALNSFSMAQKQPARNIASKAIGTQQYIIRSYCSNRPLESYLSAVYELYNSLATVKP